MSTFETTDLRHGVFLYCIGASFLGVRFCHGTARFVFDATGLAPWNAAYAQGHAQFSRQQLTRWSPFFCERICEHLGLIGPITPEDGGEDG